MPFYRRWLKFLVRKVPSNSKARSDDKWHSRAGSRTRRFRRRKRRAEAAECPTETSCGEQQTKQHAPSNPFRRTNGLKARKSCRRCDAMQGRRQVYTTSHDTWRWRAGSQEKNTTFGSDLNVVWKTARVPDPNVWKQRNKQIRPPQTLESTTKTKKAYAKHKNAPTRSQPPHPPTSSIAKNEFPSDRVCLPLSLVL